MKKVLIAGLLMISLMGMAGCTDELHTEQPDKEKDAIETEKTCNLKTYESVDGWTISYPSSWDKIESNFIQEEATGKTLTFHSENTTKEDLEKWLDAEIKRKLGATEAANTLKDALSVKQYGELWYYTYTISSKIESSENFLKTTVIFDGKRRYEYNASLPPVTEKEYDDIIASFRLKNEM